MPIPSTLTAKQLAFWLALWRTPQIGPARFARILSVFPDIEELFTIRKHQLSSLNLPEALVVALQNPDWAATERDLLWAEQENHYIIRSVDTNYPKQLQSINSMPPLLFVRGNLNIVHSMQLAIVGSRNPTPSGQKISWQFAAELSAAGLTITSGLALGIDAASHRGALSIGSETVAVLGSGPDVIYPHCHHLLALEILDKEGAVISEFPPGTPPKATHFPQRNRIVSGLSEGVLVVEATLRSGSLITAHLAAEQGREVFAVPGSIYSSLSRGCHTLIRQGAKLVETIQDILEELPNSKLLISNAKKKDLSNNHSEKSLVSSPLKDDASQSRILDKKLLAEDECQLLECIGYETIPIDEISNRIGLPAHIVAGMISTLELKGSVIATAGGFARK